MPYQYSIQCDKLQRDIPNGEAIWATIMLNATRIPIYMFIDSVDLASFLDEDESLEDYMADDPDSACYRYDHEGEVVFFVQHAGFESFFTTDGKVPSYFEPVAELMLELHRDSLARTLLPANNALTAGIFGEEAPPEMIDLDLEFIDGRTPRFRLFIEGKPVAGLSTKEGRVETLYVHHAYRRQGLASALFDRARRVLGNLEHSEILTDEGKLFAASKKRVDEEGFCP